MVSSPGTEPCREPFPLVAAAVEWTAAVVLRADFGGTLFAAGFDARVEFSPDEAVAGLAAGGSTMKKTSVNTAL